MNSLTIIGNLTKEPDARKVSTANGDVSVCSFSVAVNRRNRGGNDQTDFFNVTAWRGLGETCYKYLHKGSKVCVVGSVSCRAYQTSNGKNGASLEVNAEEVEFLSSKSADGGNQLNEAFGSSPGGYIQVDNAEELPWG